MFLSRLFVDVGADPNRLRPGRKWIRKPYRVHQRLCMAFPDRGRMAQDPHFLADWQPGEGPNCHVDRDERQGFLFRIELQTPVRLLVQSAARPDWLYAFANARYLLASEPQVKEFAAAFHAGQKLRFRLRANATVKRDGKRHGLFKEPDQRAWLARKAEVGGFRPADFVVRRTARTVSPGGATTKPEPQTHFGVDFEGLLEVTDPERFAAALAAGIGPAKGYGFGLLSVAPA